MEYVFLFVSLYILIFFFPWYITFYTEGEFKSYVIMFGFVRVPVNIRRFFKEFTTRKTDEDRDVNIMEIIENYKKLLSMRPMAATLFKQSKVKHLYWYSSIPMENPILGLSLLPIYTSFQSVVIDQVNDYFKEVKNVDVNTKYNYLNGDIFIYFDCIIKTNLAKIIIVSVKYIKKIPLLLKRST